MIILEFTLIYDEDVYNRVTLYVPAESLEDYRNNHVTDVNSSRCGLADLFQHIEAIQEMSGDVDGDGRVSVSDLTFLIDMLLTGATSATDYPGADVDGDGRITIADVTGIIDILLTT